jgi:A/G-specific adenine glycosylase
VPRDPQQLRALPGIGDYTAGAIASIAYGLSVPVLDGNVIRVLSRLFDIPDEVTRGPVKKHLWELAASLVPPADPRPLNEGLMELGALVCTPSSPSCDACPVSELCLARARGTVALRPVKGARTEAVSVVVLAGLFERADGALLLVQNPPKGLFGGLWQAPQVPRGLPRTQTEVPTPGDLELGLRQSLGVRVAVGGRIGRVEHVLSHRRMTVEVYRCFLGDPDPDPTAWPAARWVRRSEAGELGLASVARKVLALAWREPPEVG